MYGLSNASRTVFRNLVLVICSSYFSLATQAQPSDQAQPWEWQFNYSDTVRVKGPLFGTTADLTLNIEERVPNKFRALLVGGYDPVCPGGYKPVTIRGVYKGHLVFEVEEKSQGCSKRIFVDRSGESYFSQRLESTGIFSSGWIDESFDRKLKPKNLNAFEILFDRFAGSNELTTLTEPYPKELLLPSNSVASKTEQREAVNESPAGLSTLKNQDPNLEGEMALLARTEQEAREKLELELTAQKEREARLKAEFELEAQKEREARLKAEMELASQKEREARLKAELDLAKIRSQQLLANVETDKSVTNPSNSASKPGGVKEALKTGQRFAIVIGNDDYKNVPKLENAVGDAKAISGLLSRLGYQVLTFNNLNEKEFKRSLRQFKQRLKGGEEVVFFFAGHGVQIGSANYLLPTDVGSDSEDQIQDEGIPLQRVLDDFSESKVKFSLAMVDACRDNPFKSTGRSIGGRGLAATSAATGQMIIFSAGTGQQALDRLGNNDKARNGLFTRVLIEKVSQSKEPIHILMRDVRAEVAKLAQSVGHEQVPAIYDQVIGDFYFANKK